MLGFTDELNKPIAAPKPYPKRHNQFYQMNLPKFPFFSSLPNTQLINDLNAQLSNAFSTNFSSLVLIATDP